MSPKAPRRRRLPISLRRGPVAWHRQEPTWRDASPRLIDAALKRAGARPTGNWYVLGPSAAVRPDAGYGCTVEGTEIVAWRGTGGALVAGPGACPHLGAPLAQAPVRCGALVCPWHGLALNGAPFAGWTPYPAHDDGVLAWVRLDEHGGEEPLDTPAVPPRPSAAGSLTAVYTGTGVCEPEDIVANRLDPWHGAWFHPYSFVDLTVLDDGAESDVLTVSVSFRVAGRVVVPVTAAFTAPGPRTVVMRIMEGEGEGSVVETHATPLGTGRDGRPRTLVTEAVIAFSPRTGFTLARTAAPLLRPLMRRAAGRLWQDDLAYAERRWDLRSTGRFPG
ncbi:(2Fe-2S) ferredoxin [Streptomyces roseochromogenus]|nr:(2Fe-2S) ferredoxin [Streptomyces roseochromogenus]